MGLEPAGVTLASAGCDGLNSPIPDGKMLSVTGRVPATNGHQTVTVTTDASGSARVAYVVFTLRNNGPGLAICQATAKVNSITLVQVIGQQSKMQDPVNVGEPASNGGGTTNGRPTMRQVVAAQSQVFSALQHIIAPTIQTAPVSLILQTCSLDLSVSMSVVGATGSAFDAALTAAFERNGMTVTAAQDQSAAIMAASAVVNDGSGNYILLADAAIMAYLQCNDVALS